MGTLTNTSGDDFLEISVLGVGLKAGETIDVPDEVLAAWPFQYPPFEVNGIRRLGPFLDGDDFLKQDAEQAAGPAPEEPAAAPDTPQE